jgi:hypothetical protein
VKYTKLRFATAKVKKLSVTNPALSFRKGQTVSLCWNEIKKAVPGITKKNTAVYEFKSNRLLVTQVTEVDGAIKCVRYLFAR